MLKERKNQILIATIILVALLAAFIGAAAGSTYPNWANKISFLPEFLKPKTTNLQEVKQNGERVVRTVEESAVIDVVDSASPAVVSIVAQTVSLDPIQGVRQNQQGIGTGFIVKSDGVILTNSHVVANESISYKVVAKDKKAYVVKKIDRDPTIDFAILKIDAKQLPIVSLGDSNSIRVGQKVVAIGNALGQFDNTVTVGVISGIGRGVTASDTLGVFQETLENIIQTDAALNPGNSGGPLLDLSGNVIGINFATTVGAENLGFVIPINEVKGVLNQYYEKGRIVRPFLGVGGEVIDRVTAALNNVPQGIFIRQVVPSSPAAKAGIQTGDIMTKFGTVFLDEGIALAAVVGKFKVGETVGIELWREGKTMKLKAVLAEAP
ncbi:MAG: trypsin-like peptidase domain-containing protein [bacterium]|nr:trypsin-like peptidase domain-containing protein [bacterium]